MMGTVDDASPSVSDVDWAALGAGSVVERVTQEEDEMLFLT